MDEQRNLMFNIFGKQIVKFENKIENRLKIPFQDIENVKSNLINKLTEETENISNHINKQTGNVHKSSSEE